MNGDRPRGLVPGFVLALVLTLGFAGHALWSAQRLAEPTPAGIEPWMTAGLIGESYGLDPEAVDVLLGVPPGSAKGLTLAEIAAARGVPVAEVTAQVQRAVDARVGP